MPAKSLILCMPEILEWFQIGSSSYLIFMHALGQLNNILNGSFKSLVTWYACQCNEKVSQNKGHIKKGSNRICAVRPYDEPKLSIDKHKVCF